MAALIPNMAKGKFAQLALLTAANDALIWVLFSGAETDANLRDADTLTAVIALAVDEATFGGYVRITASGVVVLVDDTNDRTDVDAVDPTWNPTGVQALTRIGLFHDPDTTAGTDADLTPLFVDDLAVTTANGVALTYGVNAAGWGRAA